MEIICRSLEELRLLVRATDPSIISDASPYYKSGWGTAGVIISGGKNLDTDCSSGMYSDTNGKTGTAFGTDIHIITPYPKEFSWFADMVLHTYIENPGPVELLRRFVAIAHELYASILVERKPSSYDVKDELLYICDYLINRIRYDSGQSVSGKDK